MTYSKIRSEVNEVLNSLGTVNSEVIQDQIDYLEELAECIETMNANDDSEDDMEFQETASLLEEAFSALEMELEAQEDFEIDSDDY